MMNDGRFRGQISGCIAEAKSYCAKCKVKTCNFCSAGNHIKSDCKLISIFHPDEVKSYKKKIQILLKQAYKFYRKHGTTESHSITKREIEEVFEEFLNLKSKLPSDISDLQMEDYLELSRKLIGMYSSIKNSNMYIDYLICKDTIYETGIMDYDDEEIKDAARFEIITQEIREMCEREAENLILEKSEQIEAEYKAKCFTEYNIQHQNQFNDQINELKSKISKLKKDISILKEENKQILDENEDLNERYSKCYKKKKKLKQKNQDLKEVIEKMEEGIVEFELPIEDLIDDPESVLKRLADVDGNLKYSTSDIIKLCTNMTENQYLARSGVIQDEFVQQDVEKVKEESDIDDNIAQDYTNYKIELDLSEENDVKKLKSISKTKLPSELKRMYLNYISKAPQLVKKFLELNGSTRIKFLSLNGSDGYSYSSVAITPYMIGLNTLLPNVWHKISLWNFEMNQDQFETVIKASFNTNTLLISCGTLLTDSKGDFGDSDYQIQYLNFDWSGSSDISNWESNPERWKNIMRGIGTSKLKHSLKQINVSNCTVEPDIVKKFLEDLGVATILVTNVEIND